MARAVIRWDVSNERANNQIEDFAGFKITAISEDTRDAARTAILEGYRRGDGPIQIATDLAGRIGPSGRREGGILGMSNQQTVWSNNFRDKLSNPETMGEALGYALRDKRFDKTIRAALDRGEALSADQVSKMVGRYVDNAIKLRGETVARTETGTAVHKAAHEAFRQTLDQTEYTEEDVTRVWRSAGDARVRDTHAGMNGQTVRGLTTPFVSPSGARLLHPLDASLGAPPEEIINCRCDEELNIDFSAPLRRESLEPEPEPEEPPPTPEPAEPPPSLDDLEETLREILPPTIPRLTRRPREVRPPPPEPLPPPARPPALPEPPPPPQVVRPPEMIINIPKEQIEAIRRQEELRKLTPPPVAPPIKWPELPPEQIEAIRKRTEIQRQEDLHRLRLEKIRQRQQPPPPGLPPALDPDAAVKAERKAFAARVLTEGKRVAEKHGVDPAKISVSLQLKTFRQGGIKWTTGGQANLATKEITLYSRGMRNIESVPRITAHEAQHVIYETVTQAYTYEHGMLANEVNAAGPIRNNPIIESSGALRRGKGLEAKYPTYHALHKYQALVDQLATDDGVTDYSKAYWRDWAKGKAGQTTTGRAKVTTHLALHETMAEMAAELESKGALPGTPIWQDYFKQVQERYAALRKADKDSMDAWTKASKQPAPAPGVDAITKMTAGVADDIPPSDWSTIDEVRAGFTRKHKLDFFLADADNIKPRPWIVQRAKFIDKEMDYLSDAIPAWRDHAKFAEVMMHDALMIGRNGRSLGFYAPAGQQINLATATSTIESGLTWGEWLVSGEGIRSTIRHEIGHSLMDSVLAAGKLTTRDLQRFMKDVKASDLSQYAMSDFDEFWAESFAAWSHPDYLRSSKRIHPELEKLFDRVLKRKH